MSDDASPSAAMSRGFARAKFGKAPGELALMTDDELLIWQHNQAAGSTQNAMAEREWQRRLVVEQVKAMRFAAWVGIAGGIAGALLAWGLPHIGGQRRDDGASRSTRTEQATPIQQVLPIEAKQINTSEPGNTTPPPKKEAASSAAQLKKNGEN